MKISRNISDSEGEASAEQATVYTSTSTPVASS